MLSPAETGVPSDILARRNRFRRCPNGKQLRLTERDLAILQLLFRYRYLRTDQLVQLLQPQSVKRLVERLGDLFHETGLISRVNSTSDPFKAFCTPLIYEISSKGITHLESLKALPNRAVTFSRRRRPAFNPQLHHTMAVIDALIRIECETRSELNQRFVPIDEILARAPDKVWQARNPLSIPITLLPSNNHPVVKRRTETHLIPDALYGIEYLIDGKKRYRFWALECERTTPTSRSSTSASSRALKKATYDALLSTRAYRQHWGIPNLKLKMIEVR